VVVGLTHSTVNSCTLYGSMRASLSSP